MTNTDWNNISPADILLRNGIELSIVHDDLCGMDDVLFPTGQSYMCGYFRPKNYNRGDCPQIHIDFEKNNDILWEILRLLNKDNKLDKK